MKLVLVTAPTEELLTLEQARLHLRIDADGSPPEHPDDDRVERLIRTVRQNLDGYEGWLGRALSTQVWDLYLDCFADRIKIPLPPLQSVDGIFYRDPDSGNEVEFTDSPAVYRVLPGEPSYLKLLDGEAWPVHQAVPDSVRIRFTCGYQVSESPPDSAALVVPDAIRDAMLLKVEALYDKNPQNADLLERSADALLLPYRVTW